MEVPGKSGLGFEPGNDVTSTTVVSATVDARMLGECGKIVLRYHHLLCLPRFVGEGYSDAFTRNMAQVKRSLEESRTLHEASGKLLPEWDLSRLELVQGPDVVCRACPNLVDGACTSQEKVQRYDAAVARLLEQGIVPAPAAVCRDCSWYELCEQFGDLSQDGLEADAT